MRSNSSIITVLLTVLLLCGASAHAQKTSVKEKDKGRAEGMGQGMGRGQGQGQGRSEGVAQGSDVVVGTAENVNVTLTTGAGRISVRGWDRNEVHAQARKPGTKIDLRKTGGTDAAHPIGRIEILVSDKSEDDEAQCDTCNTDSPVMLEVPRGATVYLKTQNGDVDVEDVAEVHIETADGRIEARRISKATEAVSVGGNVALEDASGRARLSSISGVIEVRDMRPLDASDFLKIRTAGGDILLDRVGPAHIEATTISGELRMMGPLARGGVYVFTTTTGDVTLLLPADSSFNLTGKVSEGGEIITEFPLKYRGNASPLSLLKAGRLIGTHGTGDARIYLVSFSGTLRLRKQ
jgi:Putative adhesin